MLLHARNVRLACVGIIYTMHNDVVIILPADPWVILDFIFVPLAGRHCDLEIFLLFLPGVDGGALLCFWEHNGESCDEALVHLFFSSLLFSTSVFFSNLGLWSLYMYMIREYSVNYDIIGLCMYTVQSCLFDFTTVVNSGADPENLHGRWLMGCLPIVNNTGAKGVVASHPIHPLDQPLQLSVNWFIEKYPLYIRDFCHEKILFYMSDYIQCSTEDKVSIIIGLGNTTLCVHVQHGQINQSVMSISVYQHNKSVETLAPLCFWIVW